MGLKFFTRELAIADVVYDGNKSITFNDSISCEPNFLDVKEVESLSVGDTKTVELEFKGTMPVSIPEKYKPKLRITYSRKPDMENESEYSIIYEVSLKNKSQPIYDKFYLEWKYYIINGIKQFTHSITPCFMIDKTNKIASPNTNNCSEGKINGFRGETDGATWAKVSQLYINPTTLSGTYQAGAYIDGKYYRDSYEFEPVPKGSELKYFVSSGSSIESTWWYQLLEANTTTSTYSCGYLEPRDYILPKQPILADGCSDNIELSALSNFSIFKSGFLTAWNITTIELRNLSLKLFAPGIIDIIKQLGMNPFDNLVDFHLFFGKIISGNRSNIHLSFYDTEIESTRIEQQFTEFDCGEIQVKTYYGSFSDYSPYTKVSIYLPFIGYRQLDVDDIMNAKINVTYRFDLFSGECVAFIKITKQINTTELNSVLYSFSGNASIHLPFTAQNVSNYLTGLIKTGLSAGNYISGAVSPISKEKDAGGILSENETKNKKESSFNSYLSKIQVDRGGSENGFSATTGLMTPYIILERPILSNPIAYETLIGGMSWSTHKFTDLHGYAEIKAVNLNVPSATEEEIKKIENLLKQGVIF